MDDASQTFSAKFYTFYRSSTFINCYVTFNFYAKTLRRKLPEGYYRLIVTVCFPTETDLIQLDYLLRNRILLP